MTIFTIISNGMKNNLATNNHGFTLVELLVATFIFGLLVFAIAGIYISFNNSQLRASVEQQLLNDTQYAIDVMAKEIRNSAIVNFPGNITCSVLETAVVGGVPDCIILERNDGQSVAFIRHNTPSTGEFRLYYLLLNCNDTYTYCDPIDPSSPTDLGEAVPILSPEINNTNITELDFVIQPQFNPYISGGPNQQPKVTINMTTAYISDNQVSKVSHVFQTTVSSRIYKR